MKTVFVISFLLLYNTGYSQTAHLMLPVGNTAEINFCQFTPDRNFVVTVSENKVFIWDAISSKLLSILDNKNPRQIAWFEISKNGHWIACAQNDLIYIWDLNTTLLSKVLKFDGSRFDGLHFSPDSKFILSTSTSGLMIWNIANGKLIFNSSSREGSIYGGNFSHHGDHFSGAGSDEIKIWKMGSLQPAKGIKERDTYGSVFSPNDSIQISLARNRNPKVWDVRTGRLLFEMKDSTESTDALFSSDSKIVFFKCRYQSRYNVKDETEYLSAWAINTGSRLFKIPKNNLKLNSLAFSKNHDKILIETNEGYAIYSSKTGSILNAARQNDSLNLIDFDENDKRIVTSYENIASLYNIETGKFEAEFRGSRDIIISTEFTPDSKFIKLIENNKIVLWDVYNGRYVKNVNNAADSEFINLTLHGESELTNRTTIKNDMTIDSTILSNTVKKIDSGRRFIGATNKFIKVWDAKTPHEPKTLSTAPEAYEISVSNDQTLYTIARDNSFQIYSSKNDSLLLDINVKGFEPYRSISYQHNNGVIGYMIYNILYILDTKSGKVIQTLPTQIKDPFEFLFSPNNMTVFVHSEEHGELWNLNTHRLISKVDYKVEAHTGGIFWHCAYLSTSKRLLIDADNKLTLWNVETGKVVTLLNDSYYASFASSNDGKLVFTASEKLGNNFWDAETGKVKYSYLGLDTSNFLVTDPSGHYDGTEAARKFLYYTCGKEAIDLDQFKDLTWEPGLTSKIMGINKEPITAQPLSHIDICNSTPIVLNKGYVNKSYNYSITPRDGGIGQAQLYVNNKLIKTYTPLQLQKTGNSFLLSVQEKELKDYFHKNSTNQILVKATTEKGTMTSRGIPIVTKINSADKHDVNMYIVSIGVSAYKGTALKLNYASKDAADFSAALTASAKKMFDTGNIEHVHTYAFNTELNSTRWPAKILIEKTMDSISKIATADDILMIFFAGHGVLQSATKTFYLLTAEASAFELNGVEKDVAISTDELNGWMNAIKASKQLLILDACNSGQGLKDIEGLLAKRDMPSDQQRALEKLKDLTGTYILSASASGQSAYETSSFGQGLLTYSLLYGIKYEKGLVDNKFVDVSKWFNSSAENVVELVKQFSANGRQDPQIIGNATFSVGIADDEVKRNINITSSKVIFIRSNIIGDLTNLSDEQQISHALDMALNEKALSKGSNLSFIPDNLSNKIFVLRGTYELKGTLIVAKISLYGNEGKTLHTINISGQKDHKDLLVKNIVEDVNTFLGK